MTFLNKILQHIGKYIVVESGTSGIWTYKKYADRTCDIWCNTTQSATYYGVVLGSNTYYTSAISFPFTISVKSISGLAILGTSLGFISGRGYSNSSITLYINGNQGGSGKPTMNVDFSLYIKGTY